MSRSFNALENMDWNWQRKDKDFGIWEFARQNREARGDGKPDTFDFLALIAHVRFCIGIWGVIPISTREQNFLNKEISEKKEKIMRYKAIIFDLFETLITEWGHKKYTKNEMCSDLDIAREKFDKYWNEKEKDRYLGKISFIDSILYVCEKCGKHLNDFTLSDITNKRIKTKSECFDYINSDVLQLLSDLKSMGMQLAIISNCSSEEVKVIKQSKIYQYFDQIILSYEVKMQKPNSAIYRETARVLGRVPNECIFVGDGNSNELEGARMVGMKAIQAKWYTNQYPCKRDSMTSFLVAEEPLDILQYVK